MPHPLAALASAALCAIIAAAACGQPINHAPDRDIREALLELDATGGSREIAKIGSLSREGMRFVESDYARISPARALAVLSVDHEYIDAIQDISRLTHYTVAPTPPQDPYNETAAEYKHLGVFRSHARYLSYDIVRCWTEAEYDTALIRVGGMLGLADPLIASGEDMSVLSGLSIRSLAETELTAIADAAEGADGLPGFSPDALARLRERVELRPSNDPQGVRAMTVTSARRRARWLRDTFVRDKGEGYYQDYLRHYGKAEDQWRDEGAKITSLPDGLMIQFLSDPRDGKSPTLTKHWDSLTPEQKAEARARYDEWTAEVEFSPFDTYPRLYPDEPAQQLTTDQIADRLDEVGSLIDRLEAGATREEIRDALVLLRLQTEADRSQLTRIATQPSSSRVLYDSSLESHDKLLAALSRLESLARSPDE